MLLEQRQEHRNIDIKLTTYTSSPKCLTSTLVDEASSFFGVINLVNKFTIFGVLRFADEGDEGIGESIIIIVVVGAVNSPEEEEG